MSEESRRTYKLKNHRDIAARLKVARSDTGMSMDALGELVGLAQPQISRIESGVQAYFTDSVKERMKKWADLLGVKNVEFEESYWDTQPEKAREVRAQKAAPSAGTLTPYQQILAVIEVSRLGALGPDAALIAIHNICSEQV